MTWTRQTEDDLRSLDPATRGQEMTPARHDALLERVVAEGAARDAAPASTPVAAPAAERPRRSTRAVLVTGGLVAAATAGLLVLPPLLGGGDSAYASWTAVPDGLTAEQRHDAAEDCREGYRDTGGPNDYSRELDDATVAVAERRGEWITVVLSGADGFSALCTTDASDPFGPTSGVVGSIGTTTGWTPPGPREVVPDALGRGSTGSGDFSMAAGTVGNEVTGVSYDSTLHGTVVATVNAGHFALWMPGDELDDAQAAGVALDLTYTDGTTSTVVVRL